MLLKTKQLLVLFFLTFSMASHAQSPLKIPQTEDDLFRHIAVLDIMEMIQEQILFSRVSTNMYMAELNDDNPEEALKDSMIIATELFLGVQEEFLKTHEFNNSFDKVKQDWTAYKSLLNETATEKNARKLLNLNDRYAKSLQGFADETQSHIMSLLPKPMHARMSPTMQLTVTAFEQAALAQEYMTLGFARKYGADIKILRKRMDRLQAKFQKNFVVLLDAPQNSPKLDKELRILQAQIEGAVEQIEQWIATDQVDIEDIIYTARTTALNMVAIGQDYAQLGMAYNMSYALIQASYLRASSQVVTSLYITQTLYPNNKRNLADKLENETTALHEQVKLFELMAPSNRLERSGKTLGLYYQNFEELLLGGFEEGQIFKIIEQSHIIMSDCDNIAKGMIQYAQTIPYFKALEKERSSAQDIVEFVNLSGKQAMHLNRLYVYLLLARHNIGGDIVQSRYKESFQAFAANMELLEANPIKTSDMEDLYYEIEQGWTALSLTEQPESPSTARIMQLQQQIEKLTEQCTQLSILGADEMNDFIERKIQKR